MPIVNLTTRYVESIKAGASRLEVRDTKVEGLELRVTPGGSKSWVLRYHRLSDRTKRTLTMGGFPDMRLEEAREAAEQARRVVAKGGDPAGDKAAAKAAETFRELADEWIERYAKPNRTPRVLADDRSMLDVHILPVIGPMKATAITKRDIAKLLDTVAAKADGRANIKRAKRKLARRPNMVFGLVRTIFRWGISRDIIAVNPMAGLKPPIKREKPRERELSPDEIRTLWLTLGKAPAARPMKTQAGDFPMLKITALTMKLALVTGQRIGETSGTPLAELDLNDLAPMWTIAGDRTKNGEPHRVPLSALALEIIAEARELGGSSEWLFPNPKGDGPIDPHAATRALGRARSAIGIANFRVHDLRRTCASKMGELGISPDVISRVLNHTHVSKASVTSKVYLQYKFDGEKADALAKWSDRLEAIIEGRDGGKVVPLHSVAGSIERRPS